MTFPRLMFSTESTHGAPVTFDAGASDAAMEQAKLLNEARTLIKDAGDDPLNEQATARFSEIEHRLEELKAESEAPRIIETNNARLPNQRRRQEQPAAQFGFHDGPPLLLPSNEEMAALFTSATTRQPHRFEVVEFAAVGTGEGGQGTVWVAPTAQRGQILRRLSETAALRSQRASWGEGVVFPVFGTGSAAQTAEKAAKSEYSNITSGSATPQTISAWTDVSQQLNSYGGFEQRLRRKIAQLVARQEDSLLISQITGNTSAQTLDHSVAGFEGTPPADTLLEAATMVMDSDTGAQPDVAVVHPTDVVRIFGGGTGMSGEVPENALRLSLHGMTIYPSSEVASGSAVVGAWRAASYLVVGLGMNWMTDPYSQMKNNLITILGEEAVNLAVDEPSGFVNVTFAP